MTKTKSTEKSEAKQVVEPKEASKTKPTVVATENDVTVPTPAEDKTKKTGDQAVLPTSKEKALKTDHGTWESKEGHAINNDFLKPVQEYQHEKDFKSILDSGIKEIVVDKEKLQMVPHELTGEPVFETAEEYQKYLANK